MVYESVPVDETVEQEAVRPPVVSTTDQWLERISDQMQVFVDAINDAREGDEDAADENPADYKTGDTPPAEPEKPATPAKKAATSKTAEVKGD